MKKWLLSKAILFYVGMTSYVTIECFYRSFSYPLMGIVGGIAVAFVLDEINNHISWDLPLVIQAIIGGVLVTVLELLSGLFSLHVLNVRMWDYSGQFLSCCEDLVCPLFSFFWCLLSVVGILVADAINYYFLHQGPKPYYKSLSGKILFKFPEHE